MGNINIDGQLSKIRLDRWSQIVKKEGRELAISTINEGLVTI
jgi:hypothetical protein